MTASRSARPTPKSCAGTARPGPSGRRSATSGARSTAGAPASLAGRGYLRPSRHPPARRDARHGIGHLCGSPAGLAGQSGGSGIVAHWTVPSGQRTTTAAVAPPSSDAAHRAFGGHALSTAIATGSSERAAATASSPISRRSLQPVLERAATGPRRGRRRPPGSPSHAAIANTAAKSNAATSRPVTGPGRATWHDAIRGGEHADRPRGVADVQPGAAVHRRHLAPPRSAIRPCGRDVPRGQAALLDEGVEAAIRDI